MQAEDPPHRPSFLGRLALKKDSLKRLLGLFLGCFLLFFFVVFFGWFLLLFFVVVFGCCFWCFFFWGGGCFCLRDETTKRHTVDRHVAL